MKKSPVGIVTFFLMSCQNLFGQAPVFHAEQYSKTAEIIINANIENAFPLFGAIEEKKWAPGWAPVPVYPLSEEIAPGYIFKTPSHVPGEDSVIWLVTRYDLINHQVEYVITGADRIVVISIACHELSADKTRSTITYRLTGLTPAGNHTSRHILEKLFAANLKDWESAINGYLAKR